MVRILILRCSHLRLQSSGLDDLFVKLIVLTVTGRDLDLSRPRSPGEVSSDGTTSRSQTMLHQLLNSRIHSMN